jgi:hypothetical protein
MYFFCGYIAGRTGDADGVAGAEEGGYLYGHFDLIIDQANVHNVVFYINRVGF